MSTLWAMLAAFERYFQREARDAVQVYQTMNDYNIPTTKKTARKLLTNCYDNEIMVGAAGVEHKYHHGWRGFTSVWATWWPQWATNSLAFSNRKCLPGSVYIKQSEFVHYY